MKEERDRFLREFWTTALNVNGQVDAQTDKPAARRCSLEASHKGELEPATVCQTCYAHLQQRLDLLEAALRMDLKETTQVIYDAVWSDPSDPGKTYHNAAQAVLAKLHIRASISATFRGLIARVSSTPFPGSGRPAICADSYPCRASPSRRPASRNTLWSICLSIGFCRTGT